MSQPATRICVTIWQQKDGSTLMASLLCKFDIVRITLQDSDSSSSGPLLRKSVDGLGQSGDLGNLAIYSWFGTCNVKTHTQTHTVKKVKRKDIIFIHFLTWSTRPHVPHTCPMRLSSCRLQRHKLTLQREVTPLSQYKQLYLPEFVDWGSLLTRAEEFLVEIGNKTRETVNLLDDSLCERTLPLASTLCIKVSVS